MIEVRNMSKSFDGRIILENVNAVMETGKCNMIIGRSGSGKTVLLKNLIGLFTPDSGDIIYDGKALAEMSFEARKDLHKEIGVLFQGAALFDFATVLENVMFPMNFFTKWTEQEKIDRAKACLAKVDMSGSEYKKPSELSGGMQKRVGIARAIALEPKYLFCDEPNSGIDPQTSIHLDQLIHSLTAELGMTTVINTHDINSMLETGDKIFYVNDHTVQWEGDKDSILVSPSPSLREFICANTLARHVMEGKNV